MEILLDGLVNGKNYTVNIKKHGIIDYYSFNLQFESNTNLTFNQEPVIVCGVENPVTDLPWLKELIDGLISDEEAGYAHSVRIYQCTYRDGIGFLLDLCVGCPDFGYMLTNCEGETLCILDGYAGDPCTEYNVDFENKQLIYSLN